MPCQPIDVGGARGFVCTRGRGAPLCRACGKRRASKLCDFPAERAGKPGTCDRALCSQCAVRVGTDRDWCPDHPRVEAEGRIFRESEPEQRTLPMG